MYIYFLAIEVKFMWMCNDELGRCGLGGGRVLNRGQMYLQDTSG